jgi:uncharacterized protein YbaA (DUF1428 family)
MKYIDGFVVPVLKKNVPAYRRLARKSGRIFRELGALEFRECVGDDLKVPMGLPFTRLAKLKPNETVFFSFIVYKSRAHRDSVNRKIMKDPRMLAICGPEDMPFDIKRMAYGGFRALVDL